MRVIMIAAAGVDGSLGKQGSLLWHIPEDLCNFKEITMDGVILMGRKTWESLPTQPLPGRRNIVITRDPSYKAQGAEVYDSYMNALFILRLAAVQEVYIIGGGEVYKTAFQDVDVIHLTRVYESRPDADTWFPKISEEEWTLFSHSDILESIDGGPKYRFETWIRKV